MVAFWGRMGLGDLVTFTDDEDISGHHYLKIYSFSPFKEDLKGEVE